MAQPRYSHIPCEVYSGSVTASSPASVSFCVSGLTFTRPILPVKDYLVESRLDAPGQIGQESRTCAPLLLGHENHTHPRRSTAPRHPANGRLSLPPASGVPGPA